MKVTKKQDFTLCLENAFLKTQWGGVGVNHRRLTGLLNRAMYTPVTP